MSETYSSVQEVEKKYFPKLHKEKSKGIVKKPKKKSPIWPEDETACLCL